MKIEITNLELNKELDKETMASTRGGLAALQVERTSAGKLSTATSGCTSGTQSVCHIDGTDDADSFGMKLA